MKSIEKAFQNAIVYIFTLPIWAFCYLVAALLICGVFALALGVVIALAIVIPILAIFVVLAAIFAPSKLQIAIDRIKKANREGELKAQSVEVKR